MRTTRDRIRHALSFEIIAIFIVVPLGAIGFGIPAVDIGILTITGATIATLWNYVYNLGFDRIMYRQLGTTHKTVPLRILHALLFECGLLIATLPIIAFYLGIGIWQALIMDLAFAAFYLIYAFVFNWTYDYVFPIPAEG